MFCNNCGKKYPRESKACPYCGEKQNSLSDGNGFFDMFPDKSAVSQVNTFSDGAGKNHNNEETAYLMSAVDKQQRLIRSLQRGQKHMAFIFSAILILFALIFVINSAYLHGKIKRLTPSGNLNDIETRELMPTPDTQFNTQEEDRNNDRNGDRNNLPTPTPSIIYDPDAQNGGNTRKTAPPVKRTPSVHNVSEGSENSVNPEES